MRLVVAYDISEPQSITRVAKILKDYGVRVQQSVFEVEVNARTLKSLQQRIEKVLDADHDAVKYYPFCGHCGGLVLHLGTPVPELNTGEFLII